MDFDSCGTVLNNKIITASENRMKFVIKNKNSITVRKVIVDGCLINDERQRCDYLFEINKPFTEVIYLELKGKNIEYAIEQLESTIRICAKRHDKAGKRCDIVASRVPKMTTKTQNLKKKFLQKNQISLYLHTAQYEFILK
ncbi:hypothetical protein [Candidatus Venteria ishoeyi]|uniref:Uncharacterized protein n=1 Tax=Candidatus Venteria ishoeyi TaxID=1899563 RepID=A0A1H6F663_9GAMM|nr:hypothetical protein [Candidatus Venteria ishoeyi]SEH04566.1 Uncharacterised protein [Candidatus Venteria ishoeyi]